LTEQSNKMKADIHPNYSQIKVTYPFYTGKQKKVDTAGRVGRFQAKYGRKA